MAFIVLAAKLAFQKTKANDPKMPDGPEEIVSQGGKVPDYVPTYITSALASAGNVVWADDQIELPEILPVPPQVRTPDQPAVLPSDPNGTPMTVGDLTPDTPADEVVVDVPPVVEPEPAVAPLPDLPKTADSKDAWEQYATHPRIGMTLGEAEAMNKTDLMAEVKKRHAAVQQ
jgi:hypothetical protein